MEDLSKYVSHYVAKLEGPDGGNAFHTLREAGAAALPYLAVALRNAPAPGVRKLIVEVMWQSREPSVVSILAIALDDPAPEVWKEALDGLVTIGDSSASAVLRSALARSRRGELGVPSEWLTEAIEQVETQQ